ncbi:dynein heavy chain, putative [Plasmodium chabaudi chabaudi]|uniref:Dynein heavy chain, putative n=1 Tax=Plasmodium chabaudi chabaudi TaxID=31271 RepID=A0A4V0K4A5_PLACU|nr:dynein heavy chain, putative [Plasmodium chabaudi chabaudi]VTZ67411.1 dynein heavy chain, putative [Plasmodium chabaudi chabaudi]|eukprot:XP_736169.2 dynein heavy chain, putative [Plasmodium chabaudi chabaudi]
MNGEDGVDNDNCGYDERVEEIMNIGLDYFNIQGCLREESINSVKGDENTIEMIQLFYESTDGCLFIFNDRDCIKIYDSIIDLYKRRKKEKFIIIYKTPENKVLYLEMNNDAENIIRRFLEIFFSNFMNKNEDINNSSLLMEMKKKFNNFLLNLKIVYGEMEEKLILPNLPSEVKEGNISNLEEYLTHFIKCYHIILRSFMAYKKNNYENCNEFLKCLKNKNEDINFLHDEINKEGFTEIINIILEKKKNSSYKNIIENIKTEIVGHKSEVFDLYTHLKPVVHFLQKLESSKEENIEEKNVYLMPIVHSLSLSIEKSDYLIKNCKFIFNFLSRVLINICNQNMNTPDIINSIYNCIDVLKSKLYNTLNFLLTFLYLFKMYKEKEANVKLQSLNELSGKRIHDLVVTLKTTENDNDKNEDKMNILNDSKVEEECKYFPLISLYIYKLKLLVEYVKTYQTYMKLEKIEIPGEKGKRLTEEIHNVLKSFNTINTTFLDINHEILNNQENIFINKYNTFDNKIKELNKRLISIFVHSFDNDLNKNIKLLNSFLILRDIHSIELELIRHTSMLCQNLKNEFILVDNLFIKNTTIIENNKSIFMENSFQESKKSNELVDWKEGEEITSVEIVQSNGDLSNCLKKLNINNNSALFCEVINLFMALLKRIEQQYFPLKKIIDILNLKNEKTEEINMLYKNISEKISKYICEISKVWFKDTINVVNNFLNENIFKIKSGIFYVNFHPYIFMFINNVKNFFLNNLAINEECLQIYNRASSFKNFINVLNNITKKYNRVMTRMLTVERDLFEDKLVSVKGILLKGVEELKWTDSEIHTYIESVDKDMSDVYSSIYSLHSNISFILNLTKGWMKKPIIEKRKKTEDIYNYLNTYKNNMSILKNRLNEDLKNINIKIKQSYDILKIKKNNVMWKNYLKFLNNIVMGKLIELTNLLFNNLYEIMQNGKKDEQLFLIKISFIDSKLNLDLKLRSKKSFSITSIFYKWVHDFINISSDIKRIDIRNGDYINEIVLSLSVNYNKNRIENYFENTIEKAYKYLQSFKKYESIWKRDIKKEFITFKEKNEIALYPNYFEYNYNFKDSLKIIKINIPHRFPNISSYKKFILLLKDELNGYYNLKTHESINFISFYSEEIIQCLIKFTKKNISLYTEFLQNFVKDAIYAINTFYENNITHLNEDNIIDFFCKNENDEDMDKDTMLVSKGKKKASINCNDNDENKINEISYNEDEQVISTDSPKMSDAVQNKNVNEDGTTNNDEMNKKDAFYNLMRSIRSVKLSKKIIPLIFQKIKEIIDKLKEIDIIIKYNDVLENVEKNKEKVEIQYNEIKEKILKYKNKEIKNIKIEIKNFKEELIELKNEIFKNIPSHPKDIYNSPYEKINDFRNKFQIYKDKQKYLNELETLFEIDITVFDELDEIDVKLKCLKHLWDVVNNILFFIEEEKKKMWRDIDVNNNIYIIDFILLYIRKNFVDLKHLPIYEYITKELKKLLHVLPLLVDLNNDCIFDRHWNIIINISGKISNLHSNKRGMTHSSSHFEDVDLNSEFRTKASTAKIYEEVKNSENMQTIPSKEDENYMNTPKSLNTINRSNNNLSGMMGNSGKFNWGIEKNKDSALSKNLKIKYKELTLQEFFDLKLYKHVDAVHDVIEQAKKEKKIENKIKEINVIWKNMAFEFVKKNTYIQIINMDAILEMVDMHTSEILFFINQKKYILFIQDTILNTQENLKKIDELINIWRKFLSKFERLQPIYLNSEDIHSQLPQESKMFFNIESDYKEIIQSAFEQKNVLQVCLNEELFYLLSKFFKNIELCEKALNDYLDQKKKAFPRFYFLSNIALLDILSNGKNPLKILPYINDVFNAIKTIKFENQCGEDLSDNCDEKDVEPKNSIKNKDIHTDDENSDSNDDVDKNKSSSGSSTDAGTDNEMEGQIDINGSSYKMHKRSKGYNSVIKTDEKGNNQYEVKEYTAKGVYSIENEYLNFIEELKLKGNVENYLKDLENHLKITLRSILENAKISSENLDENTRDETMISNYVSQIVCTCNQISVTEEISKCFDELENGNESAFIDYKKMLIERINKLIKLVEKTDDYNIRTKLLSLIILDVHTRDVIVSFIQKKISDNTSFDWQAQLKYYWVYDKKINNYTCEIKICDFKTKYLYEYIGNSGKLVITPLTDKCYITLTQALNLILGGAPAGPAGTGKTETTKDLSKAIGIAIFIFNCSNQMNYFNMSQICIGLSQTGSWGCFDEFNRISIEVLSVVSTQIKCIFDAIKEKKVMFHFIDDEIVLKKTCGFFITMNPGYAGRTELPENLKNLFRSCSMIVPDIKFICENMLMSFGFIKANKLSYKFVELYQLCQELLQKNIHYDWGLRAVKVVLIQAGNLKRKYSNFDEEVILMKALKDFNIPKITHEDIPIFLGLINDLFPNVNCNILNTKENSDEQCGVDNNEYMVDDSDGKSQKNVSEKNAKWEENNCPNKICNFEDAIKICLKESNLQIDDNFILKVKQLKDLMDVRHCVFILGEDGCGKSSVIEILIKSLNKIKENCLHEIINPKSIESYELYGYLTKNNEWVDGALSSIMRKMSRNISPYNEYTKHKIILLDGNIDAEWIESMNTVMDDNKVLTLVSNERIPFTKEMHLFFEITNMKYASPATVSRGGVLYINKGDISYKLFISSWINLLNNNIAKTEFYYLFNIFYAQNIETLRKQCKFLYNLSNLDIAKSICSYIDYFLAKYEKYINDVIKKIENKQNEENIFLNNQNGDQQVGENLVSPLTGDESQRTTVSQNKQVPNENVQGTRKNEKNTEEKGFNGDIINQSNNSNYKIEECEQNRKEGKLADDEKNTVNKMNYNYDILKDYYNSFFMNSYMWVLNNLIVDDKIMNSRNLFNNSIKGNLKVKMGNDYCCNYIYNVYENSWKHLSTYLDEDILILQRIKWNFDDPENKEGEYGNSIQGEFDDMDEMEEMAELGEEEEDEDLDEEIDHEESEQIENNSASIQGEKITGKKENRKKNNKKKKVASNYIESMLPHNYDEIYINTIELIRIEKMIKYSLERNKPILVYGNNGTGKTKCIKNNINMNIEKFTHTIISINYYTNSFVLQKIIENNVEKRNTRTYGPPNQKKHIFLLEDLNITAKDDCDTQQMLEFLRQLLTYKLIYDRENLDEKKYIHDISFIGTINNNTNKFIDKRIQNKFNILNIDDISIKTFENIYKIILKQHLLKFDDSIKGLLNNIILFSYDLYSSINGNVAFNLSNFAPHYLFNLNDIHTVFYNIIKYTNPDIYNNQFKFLMIFFHEIQYGYINKLISYDHINIFTQIFNKLIQQYFPFFSADFEKHKEVFDTVNAEMKGANKLSQKNTTVSDYENNDEVKRNSSGEHEPCNNEWGRLPTGNANNSDINNADLNLSKNTIYDFSKNIFTSFISVRNGMDKMYLNVKRFYILKEVLTEKLNEYNSNHVELPLVLFDYAIMQICKMCRVLDFNISHLMLVGFGGSGKQSLIKLSIFINSLNLLNISTNNKYDVNCFKSDLQEFHLKCAIKPGTVHVLLLKEKEILDSFLPYINDLTSTGLCNDLFTKDEYLGIFSSIRNQIKYLNIGESNEDVFNYYISKIRKNFKIAITHSPISNLYRNRLIKFPSLLSNFSFIYFLPWPYEALINVSNRFLDDVEINEELKKNICEHMAYVHTSTNDMNKKYFEQKNRYNYVIPKTFLEYIYFYKNLLSVKTVEIEKSVERLNKGLLALTSTKENVQVLKKEIEIKIKKIEEKKIEVNEILNKVKEATEVTNKEQEVVNEEKKKNEIFTKEAIEIQIRADKELSEALPIMNKAKEAVNCITKSAIQELKSLQNPPKECLDVTHAVLIALKEIKNYSWKFAQKIMNNPTQFLSKLQNFDAENMEDETVNLLAPFIQKKFFNYEMMKTKSSACAYLALWLINIVKYNEVYKKVKPLMDKLQEATNNKNNAQEKLDQLENKVKELTQSVENLRRKMNEVNEEKNNVIRIYNESKDKLNRAENLVNMLSDEYSRWSDEIAIIISNKKYIYGDCLLLSSFITYLGVFSSSFRVKLWKNLWLEHIKESNILISNISSPIDIMVQDIQIATWKNEKLPEDIISIENALIVSTCYRWPLLIDPQLQGLKWLKVKGGNNITCLQFNCKNFIQKVKNVILKGGYLIIENINEEIDNVIDSLLNREFIKKGNETFIKIDNEEIPFNYPNAISRISKIKSFFENTLNSNTTSNNTLNSGKSENMGNSENAENNEDSADNLSIQMDSNDKQYNHNVNKSMSNGSFLKTNFFNLILQTKLSNPHFKPEMNSQCTLINFSVTCEGLEEQILAIIVNIEKPELEKQKQLLVKNRNEYKIILNNLEDEILHQLSTADSSTIIDNISLINSLRTTKDTSINIQKQVADSIITETKINKTRELYRTLANEASIVYFILILMHNINYMYQYSLDSFINLLLKSIESVNTAELEDGINQVGSKINIKHDSMFSEGFNNGEKDETDYYESNINFNEYNEKKINDNNIMNEEGNVIYDEHINKLIVSFRKTIYSWISRGLLEKDKLLFNCIFVFKLLETKKIYDKDFNMDYLNFFLKPPRSNIKVAIENPLKEWLSDECWENILFLSKFKEFENIANNIHIDAQHKFKQWCFEIQPELCKLPLEWKKLNDYSFKKLLIIRSLRPDRVTVTLEKYIKNILPKSEEIMEKKNSFVDTLESSYNFMINSTPILFILTPGSDFIKYVELLGKKYKFYLNNNLHIVSLGQGQESIALSKLELSHKEGHWIVLENIHLMAKFNLILENIIDKYSAEGSHPNFRCFLTSEVTTNIPISILERSIKLTNEAPTGFKENLKRAFTFFSPDDYEEKDLRTKNILFSLCYFHSIIVERAKFGTKGFNIKYPFSLSDLRDSAKVLFNYLDNQNSIKVPWNDLKYIFGEIMYGGHIVNDKDMLVCKTYLNYFMKEQSLEKMQLIPFSKNTQLFSPNNYSYDKILKYIDTQIIGESSVLYGLNQHAEMNFRINESTKLLKNILKLKNKETSTFVEELTIGETIENKTSNIVSEIISEIDNVFFNVDELMKSIPDDQITPLQYFLFQECTLMNSLTKNMRNSLKELNLAIKGEINMNSKIESLMNFLYKDTLPESWKNNSYSSNRNLSSWINNLKERIAFLSDWFNDPLSTPKVFNVSLLFNPNSFFSAIKQILSRNEKCELDKIIIQVEVTNKSLNDIHSYPKEGAYIYGLYLDGANYDIEKNTLCDASSKHKYFLMPVIHCKPVVSMGKIDKDIYECPVYKTLSRGNTYVTNINLKTKDSPEKWILAGVALILDIADD